MPAVSHWIPPFTRRYMGKEQAACGAFVDPASFSTEPTCEACRQELEDDEATYARLMAEPSAPAPTLNTFDPLAGYTERKSR